MSTQSIIIQPKHPQFAMCNQRVETFAGKWPANLPLEQADLILDGLFYTGIADKLICYHCGGGFRNLSNHDDLGLIHFTTYEHCSHTQKYRTKSEKQQYKIMGNNCLFTHKTFHPIPDDLILLKNEEPKKPLNASDKKFQLLSRSHSNTLLEYRSEIQSVTSRFMKDRALVQHLQEVVTNALHKCSLERRRFECPICLDKEVKFSLLCGHLYCENCITSITQCSKCQADIGNPIRIYF